MQPGKRYLPLPLLLFLVALLPKPARADVGLIIENPEGAFGFLTDAGHASVWISRGCLDPHGKVYFCEGSDGIVLTGTGYWNHPGAAAIPASLYFLGPGTTPVRDTAAAWQQTLASAYPNVSPTIGRKYIGRLWHRDVRVLVFPSTPEEDRRVLETVERNRSHFEFSFYHHNCAAYAQHILELYRGSLNVHRWLDLGMTTPRAVELALTASLHTSPSLFQVTDAEHPSTAASQDLPRLYQFSSKRGQRLRPPRTLCETALFDPKYAVPILVLEPELYPAFIGCYALGRRHVGREPSPVPTLAASTVQARQLATFQALTGSSSPTESVPPSSSKPAPSDGRQSPAE